MCHNNLGTRATGDGSFKQLPLSPLEKAVANLVKFEMQLNPKGNVFGLNMNKELGKDENDIHVTNLETIETAAAIDININDASASTSAKVSYTQE